MVCGLRAAEATFLALDPDIRFEALARDGDVVEPPAVGRTRHGLAARDSHRRAGRAELPRAPLRDRDPHASVRRRGRGHGCGRPRHAQDDSRTARAREARGREWRWPQPPVRARRRDPDQGQPPARRRLDRGSRRARPRRVGPTDRGRMRHARPGRRGARRRSRRDSPRQHDARPSCARPLRSCDAVPGSKPRAASPSTPFGRSRRPESTRSPSARSRIPPAHSTSHWSSDDHRTRSPRCRRRSARSPPSAAR